VASRSLPRFLFTILAGHQVDAALGDGTREVIIKLNI